VKLERPPIIDFQDVFGDYISMKHSDFLRKIEDRYFYWDEFKYRKDLPYSDPIKAWSLLKLHRQGNYKNLSFGNESFVYTPTTHIQKNLHEFDLKLIGGLYKSPITQNDRSEYLKSSVLEEAIASSQVEGAATTTKVAFDMLKSGRSPRNESEQMIFNNLRGIQLINEELKNPLSEALIIKIHETMTVNTSAESCAGSFRNSQNYVQDFIDGEVSHTPPSHEQIPGFISDLCDFANSDQEFIHPIIKASIIHFIFGYIHPFLDGNGRTARALFYWFLLKKDYSLIKNISISRAILDSRIQYDKAFLKTEYDGNDLTYFINYSIKSLRVAFEKLIRYRDQKKSEKEKVQLIAYKLIEKGISKRQADLLSYLYVKPKNKISISQYAERHNIVRQTARKDLRELTKLNLLHEEKKGRSIVFSLESNQSIDDYLNA